MRLEGHAACMGEMTSAYKILVGKPEGKRDHVEDPGVDRRIIMERIQGK
jgi:hypothetical protein